MGMTSVEQAVMDRYDAGAKPRAIATELGIRFRYAERIIDTYRLGNADLWRRDAARGSAELLAAIRRYQTRRAA